MFRSVATQHDEEALRLVILSEALLWLLRLQFAGEFGAFDEFA